MIPENSLDLVAAIERLAAELVRGVRSDNSLFFAPDGHVLRAASDALTRAAAELAKQQEQLAALDEEVRRHSALTAALRQEREQEKAALGRIKDIVCGEAYPQWADNFRVTLTRGTIADIIDAALSSPAGREGAER